MTVLELLRGEITSKRTVAYARKFAVPRVCLDRQLNFVVNVPMNVRYRSKADKGRFWLAVVCPLMTRSRH
jgi:hypothetical protein